MNHKHNWDAHRVCTICGIHNKFLKAKREQIARLFGYAQIMAHKGCWEAVAETCESIANIAFPISEKQQNEEWEEYSHQLDSPYQ